MHRPGADPDAMQSTDFLCDFCGSHYDDQHPMIEGHKGSLICGRCLSSATRQVLLHNAGLVVPEHIACSMCLLNKRGDYWQSPVLATLVPIPPDAGPGERGGVDIEPIPGAVICRWCIERSASMLDKDPDAHWKRPQA